MHADTTVLIPPLTEERTRAGLARLSSWPGYLAGFRGRPGVEVTHVHQALLGLEQLVRQRPGIVEAEVNPLVLTASGAYAVDAVVWERPSPAVTGAVEVTSDLESADDPNKRSQV
jgi:hypothetical protein